MCDQASKLPPIENIQTTTAADAVCLTQWHAPLQVLGRTRHKRQLNRDVFLTVSDGDVEDECEAVQQFLEANADSSARLEIAASSDVAPIEFHIDGPGFPAWRPLARVGDELVFNFETVAQFRVAAQEST